MSARSVGAEGESAACEYLEKSGYTIVKRNWRTPFGEIDVIAEDEKYIVFAEVKLRTVTKAQKRYGRPALAVNYQKRKRIVASAELYMKSNRPGKQPRLDVIEIYLTPMPGGSAELKIKHLKNAFGADYT